MKLGTVAFMALMLFCLPPACSLDLPAAGIKNSGYVNAMKWLERKAEGK
jgi:hypothetical protein